MKLDAVPYPNSARAKWATLYPVPRHCSSSGHEYLRTETNGLKKCLKKYSSWLVDLLNNLTMEWEEEEVRAQRGMLADWPVLYYPSTHNRSLRSGLLRNWVVNLLDWSLQKKGFNLNHVPAELQTTNNDAPDWRGRINSICCPIQWTIHRRPTDRQCQVTTIAVTLYGFRSLSRGVLILLIAIFDVAARALSNPESVGGGATPWSVVLRSYYLQMMIRWFATWAFLPPTRWRIDQVRFDLHVIYLRFCWQSHLSECCGLLPPLPGFCAIRMFLAINRKIDRITIARHCIFVLR